MELFAILSVLSFLASFFCFIWVLICRFNAKRMLIQQGKVPDNDTFDVAEIKEIDHGLARSYSIAFRLWIVSIIACAGFALVAFWLR